MSSEIRRHHPRTAPWAAPLAVVLAIALGPATACGVPTPTSELSSGQAVLDLGAIVVDLREENAMLQMQIDSLRGVVVYQDSIVRQLAASAGVRMRSHAFPAP